MARQIDNKTKQVRLGEGLHNQLRQEAARKRLTMRETLERKLDLDYQLAEAIKAHKD